MGQIIEVFMLPVDAGDCPGVEHLGSYEDVLQFLPDYDDWKANPDKFGLRKCVSRNSWHEVAFHQICQGLELFGLDFVIKDHFSCLESDVLPDILSSLDVLVGTISGGIPDLGTHEGPETEFLREPENAQAFGEASASYDVEYDDSAKSFYSFVLSLRETVRYCIANNKYLLFMRGLP